MKPIEPQEQIAIIQELGVVGAHEEGIDRQQLLKEAEKEAEYERILNESRQRYQNSGLLPPEGTPPVPEGAMGTEITPEALESAMDPANADKIYVPPTNGYTGFDQQKATDTGEPEPIGEEPPIHETDVEIPRVPGMEVSEARLTAEQQAADALVAEQQREEALKPPIMEGIDNFIEGVPRAGGALFDAVLTGVRPLNSFAAFGLAPIANPSDTGDILEDLTTDFQTAASAAYKELTAEGDYENYGRQIASDRLGMQGLELDLMGEVINLALDPTVALSGAFLKAVQTGLEIKRTRELAEAARLGTKGAVRGLARNASIIENGVMELLTFGKQLDPDKAASLAMLARKADESGSKKSIRELHEAIKGTKGLDDAAAKAAEKTARKTLNKYAQVLGDPKAERFTQAVEKATPEIMEATLHGNDEVLDMALNTSAINSVEEGAELLQEVVEYNAKIYDEISLKSPVNTQILAKEQHELLSDYLDPQRSNWFSSDPLPDFSMMPARDAYGTRMTLVANARRLHEVAVEAQSATGTPIHRLAFARLAELQRIIIQHTTKGTLRDKVGDRVKIGRLYQNMDTSDLAGRELLEEIEHGAKKLKKDGELNTLMTEFVSMEKDPLVVSRIVNKGAASRTADALFEVYVNSILSGPLTHAINLSSNTAMLFWAPTEEVVEAMGAALKGDFEHAFTAGGEAFVHLGGLMQGFTDMVRIFAKQESWDSLKLDGGHFATGEIARMRLKPAITGEAFEIFGMPGAAIDAFGSFIRLPGYLLQKEDQFFKLMHYRADLNRQAFRMARQGGGNARQQAELYNILRHNPTNEMSRKAIKEGEYWTFTNDLGDTASNLHQVIKKIPFGRYIVPFFATPTNIVKMGLRKSALGETLLGQSKHGHPNKIATTFLGTKNRVFGNLHDAMKLGNEPEAHKARARLAMGTGLASAIIYNLDTDLVTGYIDQSTPEGRAKAAITPPYSLRVGDEFLIFENIEPMRSILGLYVNWKNAFSEIDYDGRLKEMDADPLTGLTGLAEELTIAAIMPMVQTIGENYMLQQTAQIIDMLQAMQRKPDKNVDETVKHGGLKTAKKIFQKLAVAHTPYSNFMRQVNAQMFDDTYRMADTYIQQLMKISPWHSHKLKGRPDLFGRTQQYNDGIGPDLLSAFRFKAVSDDWVGKALDKLEVSQPRIPYELSYKPDNADAPSIMIPLTVEQRYAYQMLRAGPAEPGKPDLYNSIKQQLKNKEFDSLAPVEKKALLESQISAASKLAKKKLFTLDKELEAFAAEKYRLSIEEILSERNQGVLQ